MHTQRETLIAKARLLGHSDGELARRLGVERAQFSRIVNGKENLPPEVAALIADLVGVDPQEAAVRQMVENAKGPRRSMLEKALFTFGVHGVVLALLGTPTATDAKPIAGDPIKTANSQSVYYVNWLRRLLLRLRMRIVQRNRTIRDLAIHSK